MPSSQNVLRREQSLYELTSLEEELQSWLKRRRDHDKIQQYKTQLLAIETLLAGVLATLRDALTGVNLHAPVGDVYEECRLADLRALWFHRVWNYFRDKFDQRDDPLLGPLLRAADEVVWSCYRQAFAHDEFLDQNITQGPAPLPFIEPYFSPEAFPVQIVPANLRDPRIGDELIAKHLNQLPIPIVRLPPMCVNAPWWLIYVGHEVGHMVEYHLLPPDDEDRSQLQSLVMKAVETQGGTTEDAERWGAWTHEIFADIFSVCVLGQPAITAMYELLMQKEESLLDGQSDYPAPIVRLELMLETACKLGLTTDNVIPDPNLRARALANPEASQDMARVESVVAGLWGSLPRVQMNLKTLTNFNTQDYADGGTIDECAGALRGQPRELQHDLPEARRMTSAAIRAWRIQSEQGLTRPQWLAFSARVKQLIADSREVGTRGAKSPDAKLTQQGRFLGQILLKKQRSELEA